MNRRSQILSAIIEVYVKMWNPIWSKFLTEIFDLNISPATIRKDMNILEKEWLIAQPHTSAWRIPTSKWYKEYLKNILAVSSKERTDIKKQFSEKTKQFFLSKARERVHDAISIASMMSKNIAFATIPDKTETIFIWLANILKQSEFVNNSLNASSIVEVFEWWLINRLNEVDLSSNEVKIFIWEDNIFEQFTSCSLLAIKYNSFNYEWVIWILWPMRMDYSFNKVVLEETKSMIEWDASIKKLN